MPTVMRSKSLALWPQSHSSSVILRAKDCLFVVTCACFLLFSVVVVVMSPIYKLNCRDHQKMFDKAGLQARDPLEDTSMACHIQQQDRIVSIVLSCVYDSEFCLLQVF